MKKKKKRVGVCPFLKTSNRSNKSKKKKRMGSQMTRYGSGSPASFIATGKSEKKSKKKKRG